MTPQEWSGPITEQPEGWRAPPERGEGWQQSQSGQPQGAQGQPSPQMWGQGGHWTRPQRYGGGFQMNLDVKMMNMAIVLGALLVFIGRIILLLSESVGITKAGSFVVSLGILCVFGAAFLAATMIPVMEKTTKLGYMILAAFSFWTL